MPNPSWIYVSTCDSTGEKPETDIGLRPYKMTRE